MSEESFPLFEHQNIEIEKPTEFDALKKQYALYHNEPLVEVRLLSAMEKAAKTLDDLTELEKVLINDNPLRKRVLNRIQALNNSAAA